MKCKNGLHEIDPDDPWYQKTWVINSRRRCKECCQSAGRKRDRKRRLVRGDSVRQNRRNSYYRNKDKGLCVTCGSLAISETLCWDCLNKTEERRALAI